MGLSGQRSGDILRTNSSNVEQNYNSETGILSLTNPVGEDNTSKLQTQFKVWNCFMTA